MNVCKYGKFVSSSCNHQLQSTAIEAYAQYYAYVQWPAVKIVFTQLDVHFRVSMCVCVRAGISSAWLSATLPSEKKKLKHNTTHTHLKTLSVYGNVMVFIFMDMPVWQCVRVCVCVCVTLLPFMGSFYECLSNTHAHTHTHSVNRFKGDVNLNVFTAFACRCVQCRLV